MLTGFCLSALFVTVSAKVVQVPITVPDVMQEKIFSRTDLVYHSAKGIGESIQTSSVATCVKECMEVYSSSCYSVTYNTNTGMCTPRSKVIYIPQGVIRPSEDLFYYADFCNQTLGFQLFEYKTVIQCFYLSTTPLVNFNTASQMCKDKGATQFIIDSQDKFDLLKLIAGTINKHMTWVGLTDQVTEGTFVWENGQLEKNASFPVPWRAGNPDNRLDLEDCGEMGTLGDFQSINDEDCQSLGNYICQL